MLFTRVLKHDAMIGCVYIRDQCMENRTRLTLTRDCARVQVRRKRASIAMKVGEPRSGDLPTSSNAPLPARANSSEVEQLRERLQKLAQTMPVSSQQ